MGRRSWQSLRVFSPVAGANLGGGKVSAHLPDQLDVISGITSRRLGMKKQTSYPWEFKARVRALLKDDRPGSDFLAEILSRIGVLL